LKMRIVLEGVGAAFLLLLPLVFGFIDPSHLELYHEPLPVTNLIGGFLLDVVCFSILAMAFLVAVEHLPKILQRTLFALVASVILWRVLDQASRMQKNLRVSLYWNHARSEICIAMLLLSGLLACFRPRITEPLVRIIRVVVASFAFSALWIVPQLVLIAMAGEPHAAAKPSLQSPDADNTPRRRIIWILFDELSYDQTLDHPAPGIKLPNFDRLRTESVSFSNLTPVGYDTDRIIPSLLLGRRINDIRSTIAGDLWFRDENQGRWVVYNPNETLFGVARQNGWNSGVDGWYNPYCRTFAALLNACSWEPTRTLPVELYGASEERSVLANAVALPYAFVAAKVNETTAKRTANIQQYRQIMVHAQALIDDPQIQFAFIHLPVPHPPGIYDRNTHTLRPAGTYLDNLVLSDDTLGQLLQDIAATPSSRKTTVIVSSDHSWRVPKWRYSEFWSDEDEAASGGRFDQRPFLLIHFPGQTSVNQVNVVLPELIEHDMIAGMLLGKINDPQDLTAFLPPSAR